MRTAISLHSTSVQALSRPRQIERICTYLTFSFLAVQSWGIPLTPVSFLNWSLWPTLSDLVWLAMLPVLLFLLVSGGFRRPSVLPVTKTLMLLMIYGLFSFAAAMWRFELPSSQVNYLAYSFLRLIQAYTVWLIAAHSTIWQKATQNSTFTIIILAGLMVAISALLEQYGILDYRNLVSHLPPEPLISGPWAQRVVEPADAALGTLNYNRIYAAHFLSVALLAVLLRDRFSPASLLILTIFAAAIVSTQSRTAFIALGIGVVYAFVAIKQLRVRALIFILLLIALAAILLSSTLDSQSQRTISARSDTVDESLDGRLERQQQGIEVAFLDFWAPIIGVGLGNLGYFWLGGGFSPAHGQFATTLAELGIVGMAIGVVFYLRLLRSIKVTTPFTGMVAAVFASSLVSSVFNDLLLPSPAFGSYLSLLFALAGLALRASVGEKL